MKLIHTGDWHIGKLLSDKSRIAEQKIVLGELVQMAEDEEADAILIAGDIYDNGNPSAEAEELFCSTIEQLSKQGQRLVIIIAGNHDKPERLEALRPLAKKLGIVIFGTPVSEIEGGIYGSFEIEVQDHGIFAVQIGEEKAVIACVPYASEKNLGDVIYQDFATDEENLKSYESKMKTLYQHCNSFFREDTVNILMSHVFTLGYEGDHSERSTQLGNSYLLDASVFPDKADYIALGHVHKPQKVQGTTGKARYSGSILPYHSDEVKISKQCNLVELHPGDEMSYRPLLFSNPKPIERWDCNGYQEALSLCEENKDRECWVFLRIRTGDVILEDQIRELKHLKKDILEITPIFPEQEVEAEEILRQEENVLEMFRRFYKSRNNTDAQEELLTLLQELIGEGEQ
ncbi:MAG: exonuclease SbcCD subunit D [Lachnospiraceae bacterium]